MKSKPALVFASMVLSGAVATMPSAYAQDKPLLEEIIVTAQKREQSVHDIAGTVTAIQGGHIDDYSILTFQDLERVSAGLQLTQANPRNVTIALRGVTFNPESGTAAAVDVYQNNVVQRGDNTFGAIYDIERVEILRGAQGSVQGSTSPAGAVIIHTKKPDLNVFGGSVQSTYTDTNKGFNLQAALSVPIIQDQLGLRIAFYDDANDGNNVRNLTTGNVQDRENTSFRASLRWQPSEGLDINLVHQNNDESILGTPALAGTRTSAAAFAAEPGIPCAALAATMLECVSLTQGSNRALAANDAFSDREADITTLNLDWAFGRHQLSYVLGITSSEKNSRTEIDVSNNLPLQNFFFTAGLMVITDTDYLTHQTSTTTVDGDVHELRFASIDNPVWDYMVGLYYRDQKTKTRFDAWNAGSRYIPLTSLNNPLIPVQFTGGHIEGINFSVGGVIPFDSETKAIFTAHNFQLNGQTTLDVAVRYQEIERFNQSPISFAALNQAMNISIQGVNATSATLPANMVIPTATAIAQGILNNSILAPIRATSIEGIAEQYQKPATDSLTGSLRLQYDFNDDVNGYVSWNRAFREGGISVTPGADLTAGDLLFDDETSDSFEIGAKIAFLQGAGEINLALFYQIFDGFLGYVTDLQYVSDTGRTQGMVVDLPGGVVHNADAVFSGIDLDWRLALSANLQIGGSANYTKAEFDDATVPCNIRTGTQRLGRCTSNERVPGSPEFSTNVFAEYSRPLLSGPVSFFIRGNAKYNGGIVATRATAFGDDPGETDSFVLVDLFLGLNHDNWEVSLWSKNLLDDDALLDLTNPGDNFDVKGDFSVLRVQQERTIGFTAKVAF